MNYFLDVLPPEQQAQNPFPVNTSLAEAGPDPVKKSAPGKPAEDLPLKPLTPAQDRIGQAVTWGILDAVKNNKPYQLSEGAVKSGIDPALTCIGGACNIYKDLGVDFSGVGDDKGGVRESRTGGKVVEYNPTFAKNYDKAGFDLMKGRSLSSDELTDLIKTGYLHGGDLVQYINEKGVPEHTNMVYNINPDGSYKVYNAFKHSTVGTRDSKDDYVYNLNPNADAYKNKKFNVYRLSPEKAEELTKNDWAGDKKIYKAADQAKINDDVSKERKTLLNEIENMSKSDLKNYFGVDHVYEIKPEVLDKMANSRYRNNVASDADLTKVLKRYRTQGAYQPIDRETAEGIVRYNKGALDLYDNGTDWGQSIERHQFKHMKAKYKDAYK